MTEVNILIVFQISFGELIDTFNGRLIRDPRLFKINNHLVWIVDHIKLTVE